MLLRLCLSQRSLRQRRELWGDVRPWQPPERGHPAQFRQHLQRGQLLLLGDPSFLRPVKQQHHHHHIKPEHRGEPATEGRRPVAAVRELIVLKFTRGSALEGLLPPHSLWQTEGRDSLLASVWTALFLIYSWLVCFVRCIFVLRRRLVFSGIDEDKWAGTLGVRCETHDSLMFFVFVTYLLILFIFFIWKQTAWRIDQWIVTTRPYQSVSWLISD